MLLPLHDRNPLKHIRFQYVSVALIALCVAVFLRQMTLDADADAAFVYSFGAIPAVLFGERALPAFVVLGLWIVFQVVNASVSGGAGGGVAWWAHIGGFAAVVALIVPMRRPGVPLLDGMASRSGPWSGRR